MLPPGVVASEPPSTSDAAGDIEGESETNATSLELRREARSILASESKRGGKNKLDREARINASIEHHYGPNRVSNRDAFTGTTSVIARGKTDTDDVASLLVRADKQLARTAIDDVEAVVEALEARNVSYDEDVVDRRLSKATDRYDDGVERGDRGQHSAAAQRYRQAWTDAQRVLDDLDRQVTPTVTLDTRIDPARNGTYQYSVRGSVFSVRPTAVENVTIHHGNATLDPNRTEPIAPGEPVEFVHPVEIGSSTATIRIEATHTSPGEEDGSIATTLRLDRDKLQDVYEQEITGTEPLDSDSDAPATIDDEADDGVVDGNEDFDDDGVNTRVEAAYGTDPFAADTDEDTLPDGLEFELGLDPTRSDSDGDGVFDGDEDADDDGLSNGREVTVDTDPQAADTDDDGIEDAREVDSLGTDPLRSDTDEDHLEDGPELTVGTDPLDEDTDDDGVLDGNESYTTTTTERVENRTVELEVTGDSELVDGVSAAPESASEFQSEFVTSKAVGPTVNIHSATSIDRANVTIEYDESRITTNESDVGVFRYNRTIQAFEPLENMSIDADNDTVTGTTHQFSTFVVFSVSNWVQSVTASSPSDGSDGEEVTDPVDVVFVLDSSGSMSWNDPNDLRKEGAKNFVGALIEGDRGAVVDFDSRATLLQSLTENLDAVNASIEVVDSSGGTDVGEGFHDAIDELERNSDSSRAKSIVLLSDGVSSFGDYDEITQAHRAAEENITVNTIGFGNAERELLRTIATITGGESYFVDSAEELPNVFSRVAEDTAGPQFTDDDEFSDGLEQTGIPVSPFLAWGLEDTVDNDALPGPDAVVTDPTSADTDGDGLSEDEEIGELVTRQVSLPFYGYSFTRGHYTVGSDPTDTNTDDSGLDDEAEVDRGSNPLATETFVPGAVTPVSSMRENPGEPITADHIQRCCNGPHHSVHDDSIVLHPENVEAVGGERFGAPDDDLEITTKTTVFANQNSAARRLLEDDEVEIEVEINPANIPNAELVSGPETVTLAPGESRTVTHTVVIHPSLGSQTNYNALYNAYDLDLEVTNLDQTPFHRNDLDRGGDYHRKTEFSTGGSPLLMETVELLDRTAIILEAGFAVATAPSASIMLIRGVNGAFHLGMYEISNGMVDQTTPTDIGVEDLATAPAVDGIGVFNDVLVEGEIEERSYEDGHATVGGPMTVRQN